MRVTKEPDYVADLLTGSKSAVIAWVAVLSEKKPLALGFFPSQRIKEGAPMDSAKGQLRVGSKAPDFTVLDDTGKSVSLGDFRGRNVVLYFYPKDDTPG